MLLQAACIMARPTPVEVSDIGLKKNKICLMYSDGLEEKNLCLSLEGPLEDEVMKSLYSSCIDEGRGDICERLIGAKFLRENLDVSEESEQEFVLWHIWHVMKKEIITILVKTYDVRADIIEDFFALALPAWISFWYLYPHNRKIALACWVLFNIIFNPVGDRVANFIDNEHDVEVIFSFRRIFNDLVEDTYKFFVHSLFYKLEEIMMFFWGGSYNIRLIAYLCRAIYLTIYFFDTVLPNLERYVRVNEEADRLGDQFTN